MNKPATTKKNANQSASTGQSALNRAKQALNGAAGAVVSAGVTPNVSAGQLFQKRHDLPAVEVTSRYLIFSSQRTGSNYLCRRLSNVEGRFGLPSEYLHPNSYKAMTNRLIGPPSVEDQKYKVGLGRYLKAVESVRTKSDGCFGIKVQPSQLLALTGQDQAAVGRFLGRFDRIVLMTRRDKLGQAISGALAQKTGKWFNNGSQLQVAEADYSALMPLITVNLTRYLREEQLMNQIAAAVKKPVLRIDFEDIEADGEGVFKRTLEFLADGTPEEIQETGELPVPERFDGAVARAVRERFLAYITGQ